MTFFSWRAEHVSPQHYWVTVTVSKVNMDPLQACDLHDYHWTVWWRMQSQHSINNARHMKIIMKQLSRGIGSRSGFMITVWSWKRGYPFLTWWLRLRSGHASSTYTLMWTTHLPLWFSTNSPSATYFMYSKELTNKEAKTFSPKPKELMIVCHTPPFKIPFSILEKTFLISCTFILDQTHCYMLWLHAYLATRGGRTLYTKLHTT